MGNLEDNMARIKSKQPSGKAQESVQNSRSIEHNAEQNELAKQKKKPSGGGSINPIAGIFSG